MGLKALPDRYRIKMSNARLGENMVLEQERPTMKPLEALENAAKVVYKAMPPTPQYCWPLLSQRAGCEVWVKHENHTPVGAFKVRGGLVYIDALSRRSPEITGVITATRGNHGQSIAFACQRAGMIANIVVPEGNSPDKNRAMEALGANLIIHGHDFQAAVEHARMLASQRELHMVASLAPELIAGVGTSSVEFFRAVPDLEVLYVPIGMGSGICGAIMARDALGMKTKIVGVASENAAAYALSFQQGKVVPTETADTLADGMACRVPNPDALAMILQGAEEIVTVSDDEILSAMGILFTDTHNIAEGSGAAALAALLQQKPKLAGKKAGMVLSGGNCDPELFQQALAGLKR